MKKQIDLLKEKGIEVCLDGVRIKYNKDKKTVDVSAGFDNSGSPYYNVHLDTKVDGAKSVIVPVSEKSNLMVCTRGWTEDGSTGCSGADISIIYENLDHHGEVEFAGHYGWIEGEFVEFEEPIKYPSPWCGKCDCLTGCQMTEFNAPYGRPETEEPLCYMSKKREQMPFTLCESCMDKVDCKAHGCPVTNVMFNDPENPSCYVPKEEPRFTEE